MFFQVFKDLRSQEINLFSKVFILCRANRRDVFCESLNSQSLTNKA